MFNWPLGLFIDVADVELELGRCHLVQEGGLLECGLERAPVGFAVRSTHLLERGEHREDALVLSELVLVLLLLGRLILRILAGAREHELLDVEVEHARLGLGGVECAAAVRCALEPRHGACVAVSHGRGREDLGRVPCRVCKSSKLADAGVAPAMHELGCLRRRELGHVRNGTDAMEPEPDR